MMVAPAYVLDVLVSFPESLDFSSFPGITGVPELLQVVPEGSRQFLGGLYIPGYNWM